jgi:hypothetical protein
VLNCTHTVYDLPLPLTGVLHSGKWTEKNKRAGNPQA